MKSFSGRNVHQYDESELFDLTRKAFLEAFPNSTRIDCPDPALRGALASGKQNLAEHWDVFDHICICSPCFAEYFAARKQVRTRARIWLVCGLAVFAAMCVTGYATWRIYGSAAPILSMADLRKGIPPLPSPTSETIVKSATVVQLSFRHWSVTRGEGEVLLQFTPPTLKRGDLSLRIELPLFSLAGHYRINLTDGTGKLLMNRMVVGRIIDGGTFLEPVQIDLSSNEPGMYTLTLEHADSPTLRTFPLQLE